MVVLQDAMYWRNLGSKRGPWLWTVSRNHQSVVKPEQAARNLQAATDQGKRSTPQVNDGRCIGAELAE